MYYICVFVHYSKINCRELLTMQMYMLIKKHYMIPNTLGNDWEQLGIASGICREMMA